MSKLKQGITFKAICMVRIAGKYQPIEDTWTTAQQFTRSGSWICKSTSNHLMMRWFTEEEICTALKLKANGKNEILTID